MLMPKNKEFDGSQIVRNGDPSRKTKYLSLAFKTPTFKIIGIKKAKTRLESRS